jgi:ubiquinone/menaquinone biosynthesis C-methylase UbiE
MPNPQKFWTTRAAGYAKSPIADIDAYTYTLDRTRSYLSKHDRVLEIGCGTGSTAMLLAPSVKQLTATDLSDGMIKIATAKAKSDDIQNVGFFVADVFDTKIGEKPFDAVLAFNLLHLVEDIPTTLTKIHERLKPDGLLISKTFCVPSSRKDTNWKFRAMKIALPIMQLFRQAPFVHFMSIQSLEKMVTDAGFQIIETGNYPAAPPNRYIVAKKL